MALIDPKNPDRVLSAAEVRAMLTKSRAEADAGEGIDLDLLLARWAAEDAEDGKQEGKPSAA